MPEDHKDPEAPLSTQEKLLRAFRKAAKIMEEEMRAESARFVGQASNYPKPFSIEAEIEAQQCEYVAQEGSLTWGNRCILRRHKDDAHVFGTPKWERDVRHSAGLEDVIGERIRQVAKEGYTPSHDDEHGDSSLSIAAACYAMPPGMRQMTELSCPWGWPWEPAHWKPKGRRQDLVRAAALILAEIDRIDRKEGKK